MRNNARNYRDPSTIRWLGAAAGTVIAFAPFGARAQSAAPSPEQIQARHQRMESRMRVMRVVGLSEALGLDEAGALKLDAQMKPFDDQRSPLHEALRADSKILHDASEGDPSAGTQVDAALGRMFDNRKFVGRITTQP